MDMQRSGRMCQHSNGDVSGNVSFIRSQKEKKLSLQREGDLEGGEG